MGKSDKHEPLNHRDALLLQRRITTFLLVFSVVLGALMMTLAAVQNRDAACQDRSHQVLYDNLLLPDLSREDIVGTISEVLWARKAVLDMNSRAPASRLTKTVEILDTSAGVIAANGFRLIRRSDGTTHRYELRAIFNRLCGSRPSISMEVLPNVDYEKVVYHTKTITMMNGTSMYMWESSLNTKEGSRITTFAQLQSLFPGFNGVSGSGKLAAEHQLSYSGSSAGGQVYYNGQPLDISIGVQQWVDKDGKPLFWRVVLASESVMAERDLSSLERSLRDSFDGKNQTCIGRCSAAFSVYLR